MVIGNLSVCNFSNTIAYYVGIAGPGPAARYEAIDTEGFSCLSLKIGTFCRCILIELPVLIFRPL